MAGLGQSAVIPSQNLLHRSPSIRCSSLHAKVRLCSSVSANMLNSGDTISSDKPIVVGCGAVVIDYLASVASFPKPDEKIRSLDFQLQGGGNAGNSLTAASRLGLKPILISKIADDLLGNKILEELQRDGIDTSHVLVAKGGVSPFTYVIIDKEKLTRTCIHTPGHPTMLPSELPEANIVNILTGATLAFFDARLTDTAIKVAKKASEMRIPILIDAEKKREYLDELLTYADYLVTSSKFPLSWTESSTIPEALLSILCKLPKLKFVVVTLGEQGCVMLELTSDDQKGETLNLNKAFEKLQNDAATSSQQPVVVSSKVGRLVAGDYGGRELYGRFVVGTAEVIPVNELVDTTGAGDAFIGAVMYSLCSGFEAERMISFATKVAAANCRALGARAGLPYRNYSGISGML